MICSAIYVLSALIGFDDLGAVCLAAGPVLRQWQGAWRAPRLLLPPLPALACLCDSGATAAGTPQRGSSLHRSCAAYRLITAALFHVNVLHLVMNMMVRIMP